MWTSARKRRRLTRASLAGPRCILRAPAAKQPLHQNWCVMQVWSSFETVVRTRDPIVPAHSQPPVLIVPYSLRKRLSDHAPSDLFSCLFRVFFFQLTAGALVNSRTAEDDCTPLMLAAKNDPATENDVAVMRALIASGAQMACFSAILCFSFPKLPVIFLVFCETLPLTHSFVASFAVRRRSAVPNQHAAERDGT